MIFKNLLIAGQVRSIFDENRAFGETSMKVCMELHIGILFLKTRWPLKKKIKMAAIFQDGRHYYRLTVLFNVNEA